MVVIKMDEGSGDCSGFIYFRDVLSRLVKGRGGLENPLLS
jgi:hypothetical protein